MKAVFWLSSTMMKDGRSTVIIFEEGIKVDVVNLAETAMAKSQGIRLRYYHNRGLLVRQSGVYPGCADSQGKVVYGIHG